MNFYKNYRLIEEEQGFSLEIYLNPCSEEFSSEISKGNEESTLKFHEQINKLIAENFSGIKINSVKLLIGSIVVGTLYLTPVNNVFAVTDTPSLAASDIVNLDKTATVTATKLNMRSGPSTNYSIIHVLWQGNVVKITGESSGWYQIKLSDGRIGWASGQYLRLNNEESIRQQKVDAVIAYAKSFIGTPYVYGGDSPSDGGFDCSGFTKHVFGNFGYIINRVSRDQSLNGTYVSRSYIQPGDLIFYSFEGNGVISHVGIYLGNGKMLHSPKTGDTVKITDVTTSYWRERYVTARRIIQ